MKNPPEELSLVSAPSPFTQWGVEIVCPLPPGKWDCKFLVVVVDYFMKWVKVEALVTITARNVRNCLLNTIVCQYGIPHVIQLQILPKIVYGAAYHELFLYTETPSVK